MTRFVPITEADLHLYVDDQLPLERRGIVETYLLLHPAEAERIEDYRRQRELLQQLFADADVEPADVAHARQLSRRLGRGSLWTRWSHGASLAASVAALFLAGLAAFGSTQRQPVAYLGPFADAAARAHIFYAGEERYPVEFTPDSTARLDGLMQERLGVGLGLPDLSKQGFAFLGGRMLPTLSGAAAQLLYEDKLGRRLTLFMAAANGDAMPVGLARHEMLSLVTWLDGRISYALLGRFEAQELRAIAEVARKAIAQQQQQSPADTPVVPVGPAKPSLPVPQPASAVTEKPT